MMELCGKAVRALEPVFEVNPQLDIPIYQQLVDKIRAAVKKGDLTPGQQLPTVQEMSQSLSIARGTIKRAYDELEHQGVLEKIQGRGTFIRYQPEASGSRKERAMAAIESGELLTDEEQRGARKTLTAAAMTYVAATAVAVAQLVRLLVLFGGRSRRRD